MDIGVRDRIIKSRAIDELEERRRRAAQANDELGVGRSDTVGPKDGVIIELVAVIVASEFVYGSSCTAGSWA